MSATRNKTQGQTSLLFLQSQTQKGEGDEIYSNSELNFFGKKMLNCENCASSLMDYSGGACGSSFVKSHQVPVARQAT